MTRKFTPRSRTKTCRGQKDALTVTVPRRFRFAPILTATVLTVLLLSAVQDRRAGVFLPLFVAVLISLYLGAVAEVFQNRLRLPPRVALAGAIVGSRSAAMIAALPPARAAGH